MRRSGILRVVLLLFCGAGALCPLRPPSVHAATADISVGGVWVCRIDRDAAGYTADERAVAVRKRITEVLSTPRFRRGATVFVRQAGRDALITVGDQQGEMLVITVTPQDASDASVTPARLAQQWASRLAEGLSKALPSAHFHVF